MPLLRTALLVLMVIADRTNIRPGWNLFTPQQDIEMGRALADQAESTLSFVDHHNSNVYFEALGRQLAAHAPGEKFPYQFKIVSDDTINSFALPGGFIYVTRGLIEAGRDEPELAGVVAHQIAHVVLRHGTEAVSKAYIDEVPNATRGQVSVPSVMAHLDLAFDKDSMVLHYSREQERQADIVATQIMFDTGFDPREMAQFFQRIANEPSNMTRDFFGGHPPVANRLARVNSEIRNMGGLSRNPRGDSPDFHSVQQHLLAANARPRITDDDVYSNPSSPSTRMVSFRGRDIEFRYPDNWRVDDQADAIYVAPDGGMVSGSLAYGMRIASFEPADSRLFGQSGLASPSQRPGRTTLSKATDQLLDDMRRSNPNMKFLRSYSGRNVDGEPSLVTELSNDSPLGGRETDWLVTVLRPGGTLDYFIGVAPQREFKQYLPAFEQMIASVRFLYSRYSRD